MLLEHCVCQMLGHFFKDYKWKCFFDSKKMSKRIKQWRMFVDCVRFCRLHTKLFKLKWLLENMLCSTLSARPCTYLARQMYGISLFYLKEWNMRYIDYNVTVTYSKSDYNWNLNCIVFVEQQRYNDLFIWYHEYFGAFFYSYFAYSISHLLHFFMISTRMNKWLLCRKKQNEF